ncbi:MAG: Rrf2 family transcriptional regulator [Deltaproteobacteria bacterium]|nr:Rrf2 family transcriptional regulator [Deltaproteobacteria bacterium]
MQLTRRTDYALRLLSLLAVDDDAPVSVTEAADRLEISSGHLAKVAHSLVQAGWVQSVRGRSGGLLLAEGAGDVRLSTVFEHLEPQALVECFDPEGGGCVLTPACRLKGVLFEARAAFIDVLKDYTLRDLVTRRKAALLRIVGPADHRRARSSGG